MIELATRQSAGANLPRISPSLLEQFPVPLPPLPEQRRIADTLDQADAIWRKRREASALTDDLLRSAFLEMFGDPVSNPKGWPVRPLGEMALKISDGTHKTPVYVDSGVPFLSAKNVRAHRIDWVRTRFITPAEHRELIARCRPEIGDVLLTKSGTIGEAAVVDRETEFSLFESVALIKLRKECLVPALLVAVLNNPSVRRLYGADVKGVGVKHLHLVDIRKLLTICPPKAAQERYERFATALGSLQVRAEEAVTEGAVLFASLVHQAFRSGLTGTNGASTPQFQLPVAGAR
jgi:type I restriction enzyme S subunit